MSKPEIQILPADPSPHRCPACDSIIPDDADQCVMCGRPRDRRVETLVSPAGPTTESIQTESKPVESIISAPAALSGTKKRGNAIWSNLVFWGVTGLVAVSFILAWLGLRKNGPAVMAAFLPPAVSMPSVPANTPTITSTPSPTAPPTQPPTPTVTPMPTSTPREPRFHSVNPGETLFGLSLFYRVTADSIAEINNLDLNSGIQSGQNLIIPWPTATPPLESVLLEINGEPVMADATECEIITIQSGDSAYGLSALKGVPLEAIIAVNRQTMDSIQLLQPGDTLCIPRMLYGDTIPPTPGPSPTPSVTPPPSGPSLLYPVDETVIASLETPILLQWTAVKNLGESEWYMVEMHDLDARDSLPLRGFTRDPSFRVPSAWRPIIPEMRHMQWQVSIVREIGRRSDGELLYTFGGKSSRPGRFIWQGAPPTATPVPTQTPTVEP